MLSVSCQFFSGGLKTLVPFYAYLRLPERTLYVGCLATTVTHDRSLVHFKRTVDSFEIR